MTLKHAPVMWHKRPVLRSDMVRMFLPAYAQDTQDDAFNMVVYTHYAAQVVSASQQPCTGVGALRKGQRCAWEGRGMWGSLEHVKRGCDASVGGCGA